MHKNRIQTLVKITKKIVQLFLDILYFTKIIKKYVDKLDFEC